VALLAAMLVIAGGAALLKDRDGAAMHLVGPYEQHLTVRQFFLTARQYLDDMTLASEDRFKTSYVVALWTLMAAGAAAARSRALGFATGFVLIAPLPLSFIAPRGFYAMYLPYLGYALYAGAGIALVRDALWEKVWRRDPVPPGFWQPERLGTLAYLLIALLYGWSLDRLRYPILADDPVKQTIRLSIADLQRERPCAVPGAGNSPRVLFRNDRWGGEQYGAIFVTQLVCGNPDMEVHLAWQMRKLGIPVDERSYDFVYEYRNGELARVRN
jgi:hypothetical protein